MNIDHTTTANHDHFMLLDVLRGFAVMGIFWINITIFALPADISTFPALFGFEDDSELNIWFLGDLFVEGTMRGLFSMLFGASALILLNRADRSNDGLRAVDHYFRRTLLLMLFGIIHGYLLLFPYDVLFDYGLLGLFLYSIHRLRPVFLVTIGCSMLFWGDLSIDWEKISRACCKAPSPTTYLSRPVETTPSEPVFLRTGLHVPETSTIPEIGNPLDLTEETEENTDESEMQIDVLKTMAEEFTIYHSGYLTIFLHQINEVITQQSTMVYHTHFFDMGGMMLIGMALFHWGVLTGKRSRRFYLLLALSGYLLGSYVRGGNLTDMILYGSNPDQLFDSEAIQYDFGRVPATLGHVGLLGLLATFPLLKMVTRSLAALGRLSLTNYIFQTVFSIFVFYGFGLALFGRIDATGLAWICLGVWGFQILFSLIWLSRYRLGPLEWVWRSLILGHMQPLRLNRTDKAPAGA